MTQTEIKKELYKQKPTALKQKVKELPKKHLYYACVLNQKPIQFKIPIPETDGFTNEMPAQLLIRWLVTD